MKFGYIIDATPDFTQRNPWERMYTRARQAEASGFDFGVLPHHRFTAGYPSAPWTVLAALAARTDQLRLGTNIFVLPLDHPLDVAEQVATVDQVSNGRVFLGAGIGYRPYEYRTVELPFHRRGARMAECLEVIRRAWTEEVMTFQGEHFHIEAASVVPKPVQRPHPPIYLGANSDIARTRAAQLADGLMVPFPDPLPVVETQLSDYRSQATAHRRPATVVLGRLIGLARRRSSVEEVWLPKVLETMRGYRRAGAPTTRNAAMAATIRSGGGSPTIQELGNDVFIAGTPEDVIAGLKRAQAMTNCEYVLGNPDGPDPEEAWDLFTTEVLPAFAADG